MLELEAVNIILRAAGEHPVTSITTSTINDTLMAQQILSERTRQELSEGWAFNITRTDLTPDINDEILLAPNVIQVRSEKRAGNRDLWEIRFVAGVRKLWNAREGTFVWSGPVSAELVVSVVFEEIPEPIQWSIVHQAAMEYQMAVLGDPQKHQVLMMAAGRARSEANAYELRQRNISVFNQLDPTASMMVRRARRRWL